MKDQDRDAADCRMREHMPKVEECSLEDNVERGCAQRCAGGILKRGGEGARRGRTLKLRRSLERTS